jgi:fusion and transport protein UGO1
MVVQSTNHHAKKYKNLFPSIYAMFRDEGVLDLYTGLNAAGNLLYYISASVLDRSKLFAFELMFSYFTDVQDATLYVLLADSLWDILYYLITMPVQTIQRRIQCQLPAREESFETATALSKQRYYSLYDCAQKIIKENNGSWWNAFYRGLYSKIIWRSTAKAVRLLSQMALVEADDEEFEVAPSSENTE